MRGQNFDGIAVDFSHGDVDALPPTPGSSEAWRDGFERGNEGSSPPLTLVREKIHWEINIRKFQGAIMKLPQAGTKVTLEQVKEICSQFGMVDLWEKIEKDPPRVPFSSDGCSMWFDQWGGFDLYPACFRHDLKYWAGYPGEEVERLVADAELMIEVAQIMGSTQMAELMFAGVRAGGVEWVKASFSWGFGRL